MKVNRKKYTEDIVHICGTKETKSLLLAVKKKMPIMIYDRHFSGCDPILYRALKGLGAPIVCNFDMVKEKCGVVTGVYCTVFIDNQTNIESNLASAGELSAMLKQ